MRLQKIKVNAWGIIGASGFVGLAMLLVMMACPMRMVANAEVVSESISKAASTPTQVVVRPTLAISLEMADNINVVPKSTGVFDNTVTNLSISTNSKNGFAVFANAVNGTSLTSKTATDEIRTIDTAKVAAEFEGDSWGIYVGENVPNEGSEYQPVSDEPGKIVETTTSTANQLLKVAFGVNVTTGLEAGVYNNDVVISVVANPVTVTLAEIEYMQDVTSEICTNSNLEESHTLKDRRDGKSYRVAKLKDGNCWMQQDLELTLGSNGVKQLTPADSDVVSNWIPKDTNTELTNSSDINGIESWNLETELGPRWYYQFNTATAGTGQNLTGESDDQVAPSTICPAGWRLPLPVSPYTDYSKLGNAYGITSAADAVKLEAEPLNFVRAGHIWRGKMDNVGKGIYVINVKSADDYTLTFRFGGDPAMLNYATGQSRLFAGAAVRCLVK